MTTTTLPQPISFAETPYAERAKEMHKEFEAKVKSLASTQEWIEWLDMAAKFHNYSFNNIMLILLQRPDATMVGGLKNVWEKKFKRTVVKGERAIWIQAPITRKKTDVEMAKDPNGSQYVIIGFKPVRVFDVSQTEGKPIPVRPEIKHLNGTAPKEHFDSVISQIRALGYTFAIEKMQEPGNGITRFTTKAVTVNPGMSQAMTLKTAVHELAHATLHSPEARKDRKLTRSEAEVEAESVAHIVLRFLGIDSAQYSMGYVIDWAQKNPNALADSAATVVRAASKIIERIEAA